MTAPSTHTTPDGQTFRISLIQALREQSLFFGQQFTFFVEGDAAPGETAAAFEVKVRYSPIAIAIASPEDRLRTDDYAKALVERLLDGGSRQDAEVKIVHITAWGAGMVPLGRCLDTCNDRVVRDAEPPEIGVEFRGHVAAFTGQPVLQ